MKLYADALERFGIESQMDLLMEECAELIVAVNKVKRRKGDALPNFFEEIADVEIMIGQMREYWGNEKIDKVKKEKLRRLGELMTGPCDMCKSVGPLNRRGEYSLCDECTQDYDTEDGPEDDE